MELNTYANFMPTQPREDAAQIYKDEAEGDHVFVNYQHEPEMKDYRSGFNLELNDQGNNYYSSSGTNYRRNYRERSRKNPLIRGIVRSLEERHEERMIFHELWITVKNEFRRVVEIRQNLFAVAEESSVVHFVAEDMSTESEIAVDFKNNFEHVDVLLNKRLRQGGLGILEYDTDDGVRYLYYLVIKRVSSDKPSYKALWSSLTDMREHLREQNVKKLAIPGLSCSLDSVERTRVKYIIEYLCRDVEVEITVCNFEQVEDYPEKPLVHDQTCKVVHVRQSVADIEEETIIIYLSSEDGYVSTEMEQLSAKFSFLDEFKQARKQLGIPIKYDVPNKYYVLYGCIARETRDCRFDFVNFRKCISQIDENNKKEGYIYVAMQAIKDEDELINDKLVTIMKNYLHDTDVYVCWDDDLVRQMPL